MRHRISGRKLNRTSSHRKAMFKNLASSLIKYEQIVTTLPKAKDLRPIIEKMITIGKKGTLHARRRLLSKLPRNANIDKLITDFPNRYKGRAGGYTRIIKKGFRILIRLYGTEPLIRILVEGSKLEEVELIANKLEHKVRTILDQ